MHRPLEGKVAIITGGASGIGEGTARIFAARGASVVIADMDEQRGAALAQELGNAVFAATDVTIEASIKDTIDTATEHFGRLDCMINNAGFIGGVGPIAELRTEHWHATMAALLDGVFYGSKHAARVMLEQGKGGSILTTSSIAGLRGGFGAHPYTTAKHAVIGLMRSIASELVSKGIRVNTVCPNGVVSQLTAAIYSERGDLADTRANMASRSVIGEALLPEDIGAAHAYLASDDARHITGQTIVIDDGAMMAPNMPQFHSAEPAFMGPKGLLQRSRFV